MPVKLRGRETVLAQLLDDVRKAPGPGAKVCVVEGVRGSGRTGLLREIARRLGPEQCLLIDGRLLSGSGTVAGDLERLLPSGPSEPRHVRTVLVDDLDALSRSQLDQLSLWLHERTSVVALLVSLDRDANTEGAARLLGSCEDVTWRSLDRLDDEAIWSVVIDHALYEPGAVALLRPLVRDTVVQVCQGNTRLAAEIGRELRSATPCALQQRPTLERLCERALRSHGRQRPILPTPETVRITVLVALIAPEGTPAVAATLLGLSSNGGERTRDLGDLALMAANPVARRVLRGTVLAWADVHLLATLAPLALSFLQRVDAGPVRLLETMVLAGPYDALCVVTARRAVEAASSAGETAVARGIARDVLVRGGDPESVLWARRVLLHLALIDDWDNAAELMSGRDTPEPDLPAEFGLEAPAATALPADPPGPGPGQGPGQGQGQGEWYASRVHGAVLAGHAVPRAVLLRALRTLPTAETHPLRASLLLVAALRGGPAEARARHLSTRLDATCGRMGAGSGLAGYFAASHLALADYEAAIEWSTIARMTASPGDASGAALAHLVAAHAALRLGRHHEARSSAEQATELFTRLGAHRLAAVSVVSGLHVDLEQGVHVEWPELPGPAQRHPLLDAYVTYLHARVQLQDGDVRGAAVGLFDTGRRLGHAGLANPTLLNWRPHLIRLFRADHQEAFAKSVEDDLVAAMRSWSRYNPVAARRRAGILGRRSDALTLNAQTSDAGEPCDDAGTGRGGTATLSEAELRVARLVADGQSNGAAARSLFLSKRTVDTHLTHIYRKLQISGRSDLAGSCDLGAADQAGAERREERLIYG